MNFEHVVTKSVTVTLSSTSCKLILAYCMRSQSQDSGLCALSWRRAGHSLPSSPVDVQDTAGYSSSSSSSSLGDHCQRRLSEQV